MKHLFYLLWGILWATGILSFTACVEDDSSLLDAQPRFDLTLKGESVLDSKQTLQVEFGTSSRLDLVYVNVAYLQVALPDGWDYALVVSNGYMTINAPSYENIDAETSGKVIFKVYDAAGKSTSHEISVEAFESDMTVSFTDDISSQQIFGFGSSKSYSYTLSDKASELSVTAPDGWKYSTDGKTLTITAPAALDEGVVSEGNVVVAPLSPRGTKGEAKNIPVALSMEMPAISFDKDSYSLGYGQSLDIPFTATSVSHAIAENTPSGWNISVDLSGSKLTVTAPAKDAGVSNGTLTLQLESSAGMKATVNLMIRLYGIGSIDELKALRDSLEKETPDLTPYMVDGEVTLTANLDVTEADMIYCEGSPESEPTAQAKAMIKAFARYGFNGNGYTINMSLNVNCRKLALIYKAGLVSSTSDEKEDNLTKIHDLNLTGSISSTYTTTDKSQGMLIAPLLGYNNGAEIYNITSSVSITHVRTDFGTSDETDTKLKQGSIGGITAQDQYGSPTYRNCRVTGDFSVTGGIQNIGGITGYLVTNSTNGYGVYSYSECVHTGNVSVKQTSGRHSDSFIGGIVGNCRNQQPIFTDCRNDGSFMIDLDGGSGSVQGCGGIIGSGYGTLVRCENHGNITAIESAINAAGTGIVNRRYGGIIGGAGNISTSAHTDEKNYLHDLTDCKNYGNIEGASSLMGGLIGTSEKNYKEAGFLRNCENHGNITSTMPVLYMGGIVGRSSGLNLYNCTNKGNITGSSSACASGLIGSISYSKAGTVYIIDGCVNEGDIVLTNNAANNAGQKVQVSGLLATYYTTSVDYNFTNCKSVCRLSVDNAEVADVNLLWGSYNGGKTDLYVADQYTQQNSQILP